MGAGIAQVSAAQGKYNVIIKVCFRRDISAEPSLVLLVPECRT